MSATTDIENWLKMMPRDQIEAEIRQHRAEIQQLEQALQLHDRMRGKPTPDSISQNGSAKPPLRRAALAVLETAQPGRRWQLRDIRRELVQRGWLRPDDRGRHDLQNMMLKMVRKGEVLRPKTGVYVLPKTTRTQPTSV